MIEVSDLRKNYGELDVLKGVNLSVKAGEIVSIVGASGAGKTTLLQILGTLDSFDSGTFTIDGKSPGDMKDSALSEFRNTHIGFVFQSHQLLPEFTALENVCIPGFIAGKGKQETEQRAKELMAFLGIDHREKHKPAALSGGEQQRIAVARALINNPALVLADEPSGNLDSKNSEELHKLFFELREKFGQTFIIVTHNMELAHMADRMVTIKDGKIV